MALVHPVMGLNTVGQRWFHLSTHKAQSPRPLINLTFHLPPVHKISNSFSRVRRRRIDTSLKRTAGKARAEVQASEDDTAAVDMLHFKHVLLPIIDRNPFLTDGTKQKRNDVSSYDNNLQGKHTELPGSWYLAQT